MKPFAPSSHQCGDERDERANGQNAIDADDPYDRQSSDRDLICVKRQ